MAHRVLVVDDDADLRGLVADGARSRGFEVVEAGTSEEALAIFLQDEVSAVVCDVQLGQESGIDLCRRLVDHRPDVPVVIMTAYSDVGNAIGAIRAGAYDFVIKPFSLDVMSIVLGRACERGALGAEVKRLREEVRVSRPVGNLLGQSRLMLQVQEIIAQVASSDATILITGESGTGKELVARAIHERSRRAGGPFVAINCAAVTATLLESELFGHVKGAFTDAKTSRTGLFVQANGGTLFLDEIGEMAVEMQAKLLRVLQESKVRPVGGSTEVSFDTRILAATNRDLEEEIAAQRFREDLFYRINVVNLAMPPLRARGNDMLLLAQCFIEKFASTFHKEVRGLSRAAAEKILTYDWPGNVRELQNAMERAVALTQYEELSPEDLPENIRAHATPQGVMGTDSGEEMPTLAEMEQRYIRRVLGALKGNKAAAARVLGIDRRTLYRKLGENAD